jgi:hypothetical protein
MQGIASAAPPAANALIAYALARQRGYTSSKDGFRRWWKRPADPGTLARSDGHVSTALNSILGAVSPS